MKMMTLEQAIQQDKPFTSDDMLYGNCSRFLMFIAGKIMYFDSDADCGDWLNEYYGDVGFYVANNVKDSVFYLY